MEYSIIRILGGLLIAGILLACSVASKAERPITQDKFLYNPEQGYILVWVGPLKGKTRYKNYLDFLRLDPSTGKTLISERGTLRTTNARRQKDAAAIYSGAKPWIIKNDRGLFLIPVNVGRWVVGGVNNTALSLGSYGFSVERGKITYVGTILTGQEDDPNSEVPEIKAIALSEAGNLIGRAHTLYTLVLRQPDRGDVPPEFPSEHLIIAKIEPDVRFNNYMSSLVSRAASLGPMGHETPIVKSETYSHTPVSAAE